MLVIFLLFYLKIDNYPLIGILNLQIHAAESNMEAYRIQSRLYGKPGEISYNLV